MGSEFDIHMNIFANRHLYDGLREDPDITIKRAEETNIARGKLGAFFYNVSRFLTFSDMLTVRSVSRNWNKFISAQPRLHKQTHGLIKTSWYTQVKWIGDVNWENTLLWNSLTLRHFKFYRNSPLFKPYWIQVAERLSKLELYQCSFECDGFRFLLDFCPNLNSLSMKEVQLRDLDNMHKHGPEPPILHKDDLIPPIGGAGLTQLSFESMYRMEGCFMDYLITRTGGLESISVVNCFKNTLPVDPLRPSMEELMFEFNGNLLKLLSHNKATLKSMTFLGSLYQNNLLISLAKKSIEDPTFPIPENIHITFNMNSFLDAPDFFKSYCKALKSLKLNIIEAVPLTEIHKGLAEINPKLESLKISILGKESIPEGLDLRDTLKRFTQLERFGIEDRKFLGTMERKILAIRHRLFPYRMHRGLGVYASKLRTVLIQTNSNVDVRCLNELPENCLKELSFDRVINYQDFFSNLENREGFVERFKNLTKFEIRGPWLFPLGEIINLLCKEAKGMETLIITCCALSDGDITGLCREACVGIRKALPYALDMFTKQEFSQRGDFAQLVEAASKEWNEKRNIRRPDYNAVERRRKLSDMKNLKHLDLSYNTKVSDVSIYDAMKIPTLKSLGLHSCPLVTDSGLELIGMNCTGLEILNVKNVRKVSQYGLDNLIKKCSKIRRIYTTRVIKNKSVEGFLFVPSSNYGDIVKTCVMTDMEDMLGETEEVGNPGDDEHDDDDDESMLE